MGHIMLIYCCHDFTTHTLERFEPYDEHRAVKQHKLQQKLVQLYQM